MVTPNPKRNTRERLIESIRHHFGTTSLHGSGEALAKAVADDLLGSDVRPQGQPLAEIAPQQSPTIGPIATLALWFAEYCETWGILRQHEIMASGITIDPKLLIPLLSHHPIAFNSNLYHPFVLNEAGGALSCKTCRMMIDTHFEMIERFHMAEIESLRADLELAEMVADIQAQAIQKQAAVAVEALIELEGKVLTNEELQFIQDQCRHETVGGPPAQRQCLNCMLTFPCNHDSVHGGYCLSCGLPIGSTPR